MAFPAIIAAISTGLGLVTDLIDGNDNTTTTAPATPQASQRVPLYAGQPAWVWILSGGGLIITVITIILVTKKK